MFKWVISVLLLASFMISPDVPVAKVIKFKQYQALENAAKSAGNDTTYVFNFFATWCRPCVQELPGFEKASVAHMGEKVKVTFISLDFAKDFNDKLLPFIKDKDIKSQVYLLDEPDYNSWLDKVDKTWSGSIPATLVINSKSNFHKFYEQQMSREELEKIIKSSVN